ncbi:hypothetical protein KCP70_14940 [Salmonella enterica subsp. enterica]|nr:hypothetical protein KCP70_14940 [Salmonella enterica subsp. enterica]
MPADPRAGKSLKARMVRIEVHSGGCRISGCRYCVSRRITVTSLSSKV